MHGGMSGSIPLTIATDNHFLMDTIGSIPITQTLFSGMNLFIVIFLLVTLPLMNWLMNRSSDYTGTIDPEFLNEQMVSTEVEEAATKDEVTPAERLENSMMVSMLIGLLGLVFILFHFVNNGLDININIANFTMLFLGILLHKTPRRFLNVVNDAVKKRGRDHHSVPILCRHYGHDGRVRFI